MTNIYYLNRLLTDMEQMVEAFGKYFVDSMQSIVDSISTDKSAPVSYYSSNGVGDIFNFSFISIDDVSNAVTKTKGSISRCIKYFKTHSFFTFVTFLQIMLNKCIENSFFSCSMKIAKPNILHPMYTTSFICW